MLDAVCGTWDGCSLANIWNERTTNIAMSWWQCQKSISNLKVKAGEFLTCWLTIWCSKKYESFIILTTCKMYMNHKHERYICLLYTFNFHWHSKCDKIECTDLKRSNAVVIVLCVAFFVAVGTLSTSSVTYQTSVLARLANILSS
jgi:hypothetical protein